MKAYAETTLFSKEKNNSVETAKDLPFQSQAEEENFPIIVHLEDDASGDKKHLHYGIHSNDGTGFISKGVLTSAFYFCKATGNPQTIKISHIKADGSFIKNPFVKKADQNTLDFIAGYGVSFNTAGQRVHVAEKDTYYPKNQYQVSALGMDYLIINPTARANLTKIMLLQDQITKERTVLQKVQEPFSNDVLD